MAVVLAGLNYYSDPPKRTGYIEEVVVERFVAQLCIWR